LKISSPVNDLVNVTFQQASNDLNMSNLNDLLENYHILETNNIKKEQELSNIEALYKKALCDLEKGN
jgi:hypothetical protein